jgi:hypothetical protein
MTRRAVGPGLKQAVQVYLLKAETLPASEMPITYQAIAAATGFDWRSVKKYTEREVTESRVRQQRAGRSARAKEEQAYADRLQELRDQVADLKRKNEGLHAQMILMEGNARRLAIDPDELYKPLVKPDRTMSRAGSGRGRKGPSKR